MNTMNTNTIKKIAIIAVIILLLPVLLKIGFYFLIFFLALLAAGWVGLFFLKKYLQQKINTIQNTSFQPGPESYYSKHTTYSSKKNEDVVIDVSAERR